MAAAAGFEDLESLAESLFLVGNEVNDTIRDHHIYRLILNREEEDLRSAGRRTVSLSS
jgi:hypothetical protein